MSAMPRGMAAAAFPASRCETQLYRAQLRLHQVSEIARAARQALRDGHIERARRSVEALCRVAGGA